MVNEECSELAPNARWVHEHSAEVRIKQIDGHEDSINNCQMLKSSDVIFTASDDNTARLWDFASGREIHKYTNLHEEGQSIPRVKLSSDDSKFVSCSWDRSVKLWDTETGKLIWKNEHEFLLTSCGFSQNSSRMVVSCSDVDFTVKVWDTVSGKLIHSIPELHTSTITSCMFSPKNDRIATTSMDKSCKFYDIVAGRVTLNLGSHKSIISNCAMTPDERKFATCSWDKTINVWDVPTGIYRTKGAIALINAHEGSISSCFIANNGESLVSAGYDRIIVLWDLVHGVPKLTLRGHTDWINDVFITNDSKWIVSVAKDKQIRQWDVENCDNIKVVVEQNKNLGNKLIQCSSCNRLFPNAKLEKYDELRMICVFCRLENRKPPESLVSNNQPTNQPAVQNQD